jgi:hypothetical protein
LTSIKIARHCQYAHQSGGRLSIEDNSFLPIETKLLSINVSASFSDNAQHVVGGLVQYAIWSGAAAPTNNKKGFEKELSNT